MTKKTIFQGSEIFYDVYGEGVPVVLIHGFAETSKVWHKQIDELKKICRLITPDLPGSGRSGTLPIEIDKFSVPDLAACLTAVLQNENIEKCIMLGHSMGGYVMLDFAEKHPQRLIAFGFLHSTAFADSEEKKQNRQRGIELIEAYGSYSFLKNTTPNLFAEIFRTEHPEEVSDLIEDGKRFGKQSLQQYYHAMMQRPDRTHVLKNSTVPVLFIIGSDDVAAPLNDLLKQVHLPGISYIHILEHTGHMGMWEAAAVFNDHLEEFINESA